MPKKSLWYVYRSMDEANRQEFLEEARRKNKMTDFEMTEEEFLECEQAEAQKHDDKVKEMESMEVDMEVEK